MKAKKQIPAYVYVVLLFSVLLWASAFSAIRSSVRYFSAGELALLRFLSASAILLFFLSLKKSKLPERKDWGTFFLAGFIGISIYHFCLNLGEKTVMAGTASFLISTIPVFTAILGIIFLNEPLSSRGWAGLIISLAGIALISFSEAGFGKLNPGTLLILLASISGSIYVIFQKKLLEKYSALEVTAYTMITGSIFLLFYFPGMIHSVQSAPYFAILEGIYLGVFPAAVAYLLWTYALLKMNSAAEVSAFLYITPVFALIIAFFWLHEVPSLASILGGILALLGVILTNAKSKIN